MAMLLELNRIFTNCYDFIRETVNKNYLRNMISHKYSSKNCKLNDSSRFKKYTWAGLWCRDKKFIFGLGESLKLLLMFI